MKRKKDCIRHYSPFMKVMIKQEMKFRISQKGLEREVELTLEQATHKKSWLLHS